MTVIYPRFKLLHLGFRDQVGLSDNWHQVHLGVQFLHCDQIEGLKAVRLSRLQE